MTETAVMKHAVVIGAGIAGLTAARALASQPDPGSPRSWPAPMAGFGLGPWALGRRNWLFIGSQLAGERAVVVMSLLQSAKLNGYQPWAYLKDVLSRLPAQLNNRIEELLPHKWQPVG